MPDLDAVEVLHATIVALDPHATVEWDKVYSTLYVSCTSAAAEPIRVAVLPLQRGALLVLRYRSE
jgi:hypothetical protein